MKSNKILFFVIIVLSGLVFLFGYSYLKSTKETQYLFNNSYQAGTKFDPATMVTPVTVDSKLVTSLNVRTATGEPARYITEKDLNNYIGQKLLYDVYAGSPVIDTLIGDKGGSPVEMNLKPNMVAVTVETTNTKIGSPYIKRGAFVNVYAGYTEKKSDTDSPAGTQQNKGQESQASINDKQVERLLFENVRVLDVLINEATGVPPTFGVTLELPPEQSTILNYYAEFGSLRCAVVKPNQYKSIGTFDYKQGDSIKQYNSAK